MNSRTLKSQISINEILINNTEYYNQTIENPFDKSTTVFTVKKRYTKLKYLGGGSQGSVVEAYDLNNKEIVAIKKVKLSISQRIKNNYREIEALSMLAHPHIIQVKDIFTPVTRELEMNDYYIVMNKIDNKLSSLGNPMHGAVKYLIGQLLTALDYLHSNNVTHRDLKPNNIGITQDSDLMIYDFGLANIDTTQNNNKKTENVGTVSYKAPEALLELDYSTPIDMWSVGCIIAELYLGKQLFRIEDNQKTITSNNQLNKIFSILGKPTDFNTIYPEATDGLITYLSKIDGASKSRLNDIFTDAILPPDDLDANDSLRDLLSGLLQLNPLKRLTAKQALQHTFFDEWREELEQTESWTCKKISEFSDANQPGTYEEHLHLIWERIQKFRN